MKDTNKNVYSVVMVILTVLAVIAVLGLAIGIRFRIFIIDSMYPSIHRGSLVLVNEKADWGSLNAGDVIVFRSSPTEVMHRIIKVTDKGFILRPDNGTGESLVTKDMYVGKEVIAFPFIGGMIKPVIQCGKTFVIIVAITMIILGCLSLRRKKS